MAAALTRAKKLYTTRKNSLIRLLDPIPQLIGDRGVGMERLMDHRKGCKAAWEQFALAHDGLVEARPEEDDPDEEEFGALDARKNELMGALAAAIGNINAHKLHQDKQADDERAQRERQAEEQRVQQERQAELERLHQQKLNQVIVRCLRLANLYAQAKEHLTRLLGELSLDEPPSAEELVVGDHMLVNARVAMNEANKQSLELAEMNPDMAAELMGMDATETGSFYKLEKEILIKVNKFKALYPSLCPAPVHVPAAGATATTATKVGSFKFEKRTLSKFGGTLREYPTFNKDWTTHVSPNYDKLSQLYELKTRVPARVKNWVEKFTTMAEFWRFMDSEFGDEDELVCDRLAYLKQYKHSKDARTDAQKFWGMYE